MSENQNNENGRLTPEVDPNYISYPLAPKKVKEVPDFDVTNWKMWFDNNDCESNKKRYLRNLGHVLIREKRYLLTEVDRNYVMNLIVKVQNEIPDIHENHTDFASCMSRYLTKQVLSKKD